MTEVLSASASHIMNEPQAAADDDHGPPECGSSAHTRLPSAGPTTAMPQTTTPREASPSSCDARRPSPPPSRLSTRSQQAPRPSSRGYSTTPTLTLQSSLPYALVRDFAYPNFHPMHFGGPPSPSPTSSGPPSSATSHPVASSTRRLSDSAEGSTGRGMWSAGPWGGDGVMYEEMEPLPSTSFGHPSGADHLAGGSGIGGRYVGDDWVDEATYRKMKHRKSRSFDDKPNYERGRRRSSGSGKREKETDHHLSAGGSYTSASDPAGRDALRHSRGSPPRRDSHPHNNHSSQTSTLPSRSFHSSQPSNPLSDLPLDAETPLSPLASPLRSSLCPDDETLYAGPSLALYNFEPENDNELQLVEGQTILVSYRHGQGWLVAENPATGEQGLVPEAYVRLLRDIEGWDREKGGWTDDLEEEDGELTDEVTGEVKQETGETNEVEHESEETSMKSNVHESEDNGRDVSTEKGYLSKD